MFSASFTDAADLDHVVWSTSAPPGSSASERPADRYDQRATGAPASLCVGGPGSAGHSRSFLIFPGHPRSFLIIPGHLAVPGHSRSFILLFCVLIYFFFSFFLSTLFLPFRLLILSRGGGRMVLLLVTVITVRIITTGVLMRSCTLTTRPRAQIYCCYF